MYKKIFILILGYLVINNLALAEQLSGSPEWLKHGKALDGKEDIKLHVCDQKRINDNIYCLNFIVSFWDKFGDNKLHLYVYDLKNLDFKELTTIENYILKYRCERIEDEKKCKLYIWKKPNSICEFDNSFDFGITTEYSSAAGSKSSDLKKLRLNKVNKYNSFQKNRDKHACDYSFFDSNGYAYIQYHFGDNSLCDPSPSKPNLTMIRGRRHNATIASRGRSANRGRNDSVINDSRTPQHDDNDIMKTITYNNKLYNLVDNYGYVNFNTTFLLRENWDKNKFQNMINILNGKIVEYSPIDCLDRECRVSLSSNNLAIILDSNDTPVFYLSNQNNVSKLYRISLIIKKIGDMLKLQKESQQIFNLMEKDDQLLLNKLFKKQSAGPFEFYSKQFSIPDPKKFGDKFNYITGKNKLDHSFMINPEVILSKYSHSWKTWILHNSKTNSSSRFKIDTPKKKTTPPKNEPNCWGERTKFYKTKIHGTKKFAYQILSPNISKKKFHFLESYKPSFENERIGLWIILDDFMDLNGNIARKLHKFKISKKFQKIINNAIRMKTHPFRLDLIQGNTIKRMDNPSLIINNSTYSKISEIESLKLLEDHNYDEESYQWELHLILSEKTSGMPDKNILNDIRKKLKELKVRRIALWEFCDGNIGYVTINDLIFSDEINSDKQFSFQYKKFNNENFKEVKIPYY